ncbi:hypothetical protein IMZ48_45825 [Candidatus Bathyarchaeota archaeon]|nr:hypothetical protein [Candidatus Bathyarchaeota archaeon]
MVVDNNDGSDGWRSNNSLLSSTAPGAPLPNIKATVNSCSESIADNLAEVRVTDMKMTYDKGDLEGSGPCPVLEDIEPAKCLFESSAEDLDSKVAAAMLDEMHCNKGTWQTIAAPCESKALRQGAGFGVGWGGYRHWLLPCRVFFELLDIRGSAKTHPVESPRTPITMACLL